MKHRWKRRFTNFSMVLAIHIKFKETSKELKDSPCLTGGTEGEERQYSYSS